MWTFFTFARHKNAKVKYAIILSTVVAASQSKIVIITAAAAAAATIADNNCTKLATHPSFSLHQSVEMIKNAMVRQSSIIKYWL